MSYFRHVLVTTDFSELAERGVAAAFELAQHNGARITLCHVLEATARPNPLYAHYAPVESTPPEVVHSSERRAEAALRARIPEALRERTAISLSHGAVVDEILRVAAERGCDLIVLSSHGHTGLLERLIGGVAERVVRHAACPVLVMR